MTGDDTTIEVQTSMSVACGLRLAGAWVQAVAVDQLGSVMSLLLQKIERNQHHIRRNTEKFHEVTTL